jgi:ABC-type transport system involved in multi-copper enzyme maturation permease subunit
MRGRIRAAFIMGLGSLLVAIRSRLLLVSLAFAVILVALSVAAASVSFGEQARLIVDVGLAAASGLGSLMATSLAVVSFATELDRRTAYPVLARPIPRWAFVLGKFLGVATAMEIVVGLMIMATAVTVWLYGDPVPAALWACWWLTSVEMLVVIAIAVMFSTMTVPVLAATYTVCVILVGNLASDLVRLATRLEKEDQILGTVLHWLYYIPPNLGKLSLRPQAANDLAVPIDYLVTGTLYGLAYTLAALVLAMWIFDRRRTI